MIEWHMFYGIEKVCSKEKNFTFECFEIEIHMQKLWTHKIIGFVI